MRHGAWLLACILLAVGFGPVHAQSYGSWARPCDSRLGPRFSAPYVHGVLYGGTGPEFVTEWASVSAAMPLPSENWYQATPSRDPVSVDGKHQWVQARVLAYCFVERNPYWIRYSAIPIGYAGLLRPVRISCAGGGSGEGGGGTEIAEPVGDERYANGPAPASGPAPYPGSVTCGSGGGTYTGYTWTGAGGSTCSQQYVRIEVFNEETGSWDLYWEGETAVCH